MKKTIPIAELEVSPRTAAFLESLGVGTLGELLDRPEIAAPPMVAAELEVLFDEMDVEYAGELRVEKGNVEHRAEGDVAARWKTIESWLRERHPELLEELRPPAQADAIAAVEKDLGQKLPDDYKRFLAIHDGQKPNAAMVGTCALLPVAEVPVRHRRLASLMQDAEEEMDPELADPGVRAAAFLPGWVPIGVSARGRDYLCIDLDPAEGGTSGQIIEVSVDFDDRPKIAASFADLLSLYFEQLQTGEIEIE